ncbi:putative 1,3-beta-glucanosyltransferase [Talaromyces proteolyticus]|uniref:1,3-beta-glucanosyltransferase n=1 Tax=Talaromyces proteolyticus TaxID=1131652 RepID=A0AAD4KXZ0_9EURO|nr:putative 1,3-beta-glucanosyltransferase [Talaromyces proteolyticus]KAH8702325.1 putative 1,3-beta-glucanosyltransferase [Talaromyces proteolyticus]
MKSSILAAGAFLAGSAFASTALDPVISYGSKFFYKTNGTQFYIRGVAYQEPVTATTTSTFIDPLADISTCKRDIPYLTAIRTNTIRVYGVQANSSHDDCVNAFAAAGIYIIVDLGSPTDSINRNSPSWETSLYTRYTEVIDAFANYTNVIGFFAGNEVSNSVNTTAASAFVKAAVRDSKAYIKQKGYGKGVGYAAADVTDIRVQLADYFNCGTADESVDFFGDNVYEWCGTTATYKSSGYNDINSDFSNYSVPYFFAEYGCNKVQPRTFTNIEAMYGPDMEDMLNGGIVYEYFQDTNSYGLVTTSGSSIKTLDDYSAFSTEIVKATPTGINKASYTPTNTALRACPTVDASWQAASALPPTPNKALCDCMFSSLTCVVQDSTSTTAYGDLFNYFYGLDGGKYVTGITANGTTGVYGAYSMCEDKEKLSWAMNDYYQAQVAANNANGACDFSSKASTQAATTTGSCSSLISAVGTAGTGSVSATGTGSSSSSSGAAYPGFAPTAVFVGKWQMGAYIVTALLSGAAMLVL